MAIGLSIWSALFMRTEKIAVFIMHIVLASLGFPWWLRLEHSLNLLFMGLLIRSGIQIIGTHPRFY
jgi:hypothetical protein